MSIHQLEELSFNEALDLLETRLVDIRENIEKTQQKIDNGEYGEHAEKMASEIHAMKQDRAEIEQRMEKLREKRAEHLAAIDDNLLTETISIFDRIGARIEKLLGQ